MSLLLFFSILISLSLGQSIFVVRRNNANEASFETIRLDGTLISKSTLTYKYPDPLIETTVNPLTKECYVIGYPDSAKGEAVLYVLNSSLGVVNKYQPDGVALFDLQFDVTLNALFGIYVNSRYGRTISSFTFSPSNTSQINHSPIVDLPYMWYVNASTMGNVFGEGIYFGLLNNFPGQPNSTNFQKLAAVDVSSTPPVFAKFIDIVPQDKLTIRYIVFFQNVLYGVAKHEYGHACLVRFTSLYSGKYVSIISFWGYQVGPIAANPIPNAKGKIYLLLSSSSLAHYPMSVFEVDLATMKYSNSPLPSDDTGVVVAATFAPWKA